MDASKIAKIRTLAEHGATPGERAAAQKALRRIGVAAAEGAANVGRVQQQFTEDVNKAMAEMFKKMGITLQDVMASNEQLAKLLEQMMADTVVQSEKPSHGGRVFYDRS